MGTQGRTHAQWDTNTVGPYRVLRRLRGVLSTEAGKLYSALRTGNGRRTLLVRPLEREEHYFPASEWRLRVRAGPLPTPYVALEVEQAPQGSRAMEELTDGLDAITSAMEQLEKHPEAAAHLLARPAPAPRQSGRWEAARPYWAALGGALVVAMLCVPRAWAPPPAATAQPVPTEVAEEALAEPVALPTNSVNARAVPPGVGLDLPRKPFDRQHRAPCEEGETEIQLRDGARTCWVGVTYSADVCRRKGYEWKGGCYLPSIPAPPEPSSTLPQRTPPVPAAQPAR